LTSARLHALIDSYDGSITCVGLMGGDNDPQAVIALLSEVRRRYGGRLHTGWYSGRTWQPDRATLAQALDYLKLGPYIEHRGPLSDPGTNQRFYRVEPDGSLTDLTHRFQRKH
ncbi:MAG: anaerobic ribonucleoside-triphosphate reductase activating protein, partial [Alloprevotella sp.]|nr:anaerobic ribonucleoside-triphosphate reductase activating protein [Alloprevotella sp.]